MINKIYKSVLITGASSGIGLETLKRFLKENVKVYALDKDVSILEKLKKKHKFEIIQIENSSKSNFLNTCLSFYKHKFYKHIRATFSSFISIPYAYGCP